MRYFLVYWCYVLVLAKGQWDWGRWSGCRDCRPRGSMIHILWILHWRRYFLKEIEKRIEVRKDDRRELVATKIILQEINKATLDARAFITNPNRAGRVIRINECIKKMKKELGEENFTHFLDWVFNGLRRGFGRHWTDKWLPRLAVRDRNVKVELKTPDGCYASIDNAIEETDQ